MTAYDIYNECLGQHGCNECCEAIRRACQHYVDTNGFYPYSEKVFDGYAIFIDEKEY